MEAQDGVRMRLSRLSALLHLNLTRLLFPEQLPAKKLHIGTWIIKYGEDSRDVTETWIAYSQIADVDYKRGILWDTLIVKTLDDLDPLVVRNVWKKPVRECVKYMCEQLEKHGVRNAFGAAQPKKREVAEAPPQSQIGAATS
jgi:hypothetical protein